MEESTGTMNFNYLPAYPLSWYICLQISYISWFHLTFTNNLKCIKERERETNCNISHSLGQGDHHIMYNVFAQKDTITISEL